MEYQEQPDNKQHGMTLMELLVSIAVIAIFMGMVLPAFARARQQARSVSCVNNLRQIGLAFEMYLLEHDGYYPAAQDPVSTSPYYWLWMGRGWRTCLEPYVPRGEGATGVFWCPADPRAKKQYDATSYAYSMAFYHSPEQINTLNTSADTWDSARALPPVPQRAASVLFPDKKYW